MEKIIGIYKITNPKNKVYIGSSININKRIENYKYNQCPQQPKIHNSIKKYGWKQHKFEIIELCSKEEIINREKHWVEHYDSITNGLNLQIPGANRVHKVKTLIFNNDWCNKISESKKGKAIEATKKPVLQYDLENNFIQEYESQREAMRITGVNNSAINNALKGVSTMAGGFIWKYKI
jgi:hypothetical protein